MMAPQPSACAPTADVHNHWTEDHISLQMFAERLQQVAALRGMSQSDIARAMSQWLGRPVSRKQVWTWFDGRSEPGHRDTTALCHVLRIPMEYLVAGETNRLTEPDRKFLVRGTKDTIPDDEGRDKSGGD